MRTIVRWFWNKFRSTGRTGVIIAIALAIGAGMMHIVDGAPTRSVTATPAITTSPATLSGSADRSTAGAVAAAEDGLTTVLATLLMSPSQRDDALTNIVDPSVKLGLRQQLDGLSPVLTTPLDLPTNEDNRALAYYYVSVLGPPRVLSYTDTVAKIAILNTASAGRRDKAVSVDVRGISIVEVRWVLGGWKFRQSTNTGTPQVLSTPADMAQLIRSFEELRA